MKKYARILVAVTFLLGLGVAANAETRAEVVVTLPFQFVVGGQTLPAGEYTVSRLSDQVYGPLMFTSYDTRTSVFVNPNEVESVPANKIQVTFQQVGEHYLLSSIQSADYIYNIAVSHSAVMAAAAKPQDYISVSSGSGSN